MQKYIFIELTSRTLIYTFSGNLVKAIWYLARFDIYNHLYIA